MARTDKLANFLTDVAGAIKAKKGTSAKISAANFDSEIQGFNLTKPIFSIGNIVFESEIGRTLSVGSSRPVCKAGFPSPRTYIIESVRAIILSDGTFINASSFAVAKMKAVGIMMVQALTGTTTINFNITSKTTNSDGSFGFSIVNAGGVGGAVGEVDENAGKILFSYQNAVGQYIPCVLLGGAISGKNYTNVFYNYSFGESGSLGNSTATIRGGLTDAPINKQFSIANGAASTMKIAKYLRLTAFLSSTGTGDEVFEYWDLATENITAETPQFDNY